MHSIEIKLYSFVRSLVNPGTGLVSRQLGDGLCTVYGNALAVLAFCHQNDLALAERVLAVFEKYCRSRADGFEGLPNVWECATGLPDRRAIAWEGDSGMLLLASQYYGLCSRRENAFRALDEQISRWLDSRSRNGPHLDAEAASTIYAAMLIHKDDPNSADSLRRLKAAFFSSGSITSCDYPHFLSHIVAGALVFDDPEAVDHAAAFRCRHVIEGGTSVSVQGFKETPNGTSLSVEQTARFLIAWERWRPASGRDYAHVVEELSKLVVPSSTSTECAGLPRSAPRNASSLSPPDLEASCWYLFALWRFNPYELSQSKKPAN